MCHVHNLLNHIMNIWDLYGNIWDLCDRKKVSYQVDRRSSMRFYLRVFFDFMDISVVNSKIIYDKIEGTTAMTALDIKYCVSARLTRNFSSRKRSYPSSRSSKRSSTSTAFAAHHLPVFRQTRVRCVQCSNEIKVENRTDVWCETCNVALCLTRKRNCFFEYHI